jgi:hypothetical protein
MGFCSLLGKEKLLPGSSQLLAPRSLLLPLLLRYRVTFLPRLFLYCCNQFLVVTAIRAAGIFNTPIACISYMGSHNFASWTSPLSIVEADFPIILVAFLILSAPFSVLLQKSRCCKVSILLSK